MPVGHVVPGGRSTAVAVHTGPAEQSWTPTWHSSPGGTQSPPWVQPTHAALASQTWFAPQLVPGAWKPMGVSWVQTGTPVVQEFVPRVHGLAAG